MGDVNRKVGWGARGWGMGFGGWGMRDGGWGMSSVTWRSNGTLTSSRLGRRRGYRYMEEV